MQFDCETEHIFEMFICRELKYL